ncbi:fibronectin type III domain-containing protein [Bacillus toyonensis]|uniref:fibronectin type III domain-containing protein n=1 Tax=Bacillus toyonensis TaxID=155322 RepID=UPI00159BD447|nr:fibronectin type III domain-containing protein [Bacillus toyonensis]
MRVKKYLAVFSLMMIMCLSVLPTFTSAAVVRKTDVYTKWYIKSYSPESTFKGKEEGTSYLYGKEVITDLGDEYSIKYVKYYAQGGVDGGYIAFYDKDFKFISQNKMKYYGADSQFDVGKKARYVSVGQSTSESPNALKVYDLSVFIDDGKVSDVTNLKAKADINKVELTWENPVEDGFNGVNIYQDDVLITTLDKSATSYMVSDLKDNIMYKFKVSSLDGSKVETKGVETSVKTLLDPKKVPPGPVSSLVAEPTDKTVKLKWKKSSDDDLAGFKILQNGKKIAEIGLEEQFTVKNLEPLTEYTFDVISVDKDKNDSPPVSLSVKTLEEKDEEPPHVPSNVFAKPSNGALIASWDKVSDKDLAGYNVYVDGKKINSNLITSTNFVIKNLENSKKYKIQVQAVDRSGNVSELSLSAFGTPDINTIPIIESKYSLEDVSDGVGVMFSQLWFVLAFAVGIPLAFYVIYKLKHIILP